MKKIFSYRVVLFLLWDVFIIDTMMNIKKNLFLLCLLGAVGLTCAQQPVHWSFLAKKIGDRKYALHLTATVDAPWHIYSQHIGEGGPLPTQIIFVNSPLVTVEGKTAEEGKLLQKHEDVFDMDVKYYSGAVDFVQVVTLKGNIKTSVKGTIHFMACTDAQCLPPATVPFSIPLE